MSYIDGFVAAVPTANKAQYLEYAKFMAKVFKENGAIRVVETWGEEVPEGEVTSFPMAVQCKDDETIVFAWMEWPDKATRDKGWQVMMEDERLHADMPFDGKRLIYGGFDLLLDA